METTKDGRLEALRRRTGAPDEANVLVMLGFLRSLSRDVDALVEALECARDYGMFEDADDEGIDGVPSKLFHERWGAGHVDVLGKLRAVLEEGG